MTKRLYRGLVCAVVWVWYKGVLFVEFDIGKDVSIHCTGTGKYELFNFMLLSGI